MSSYIYAVLEDLETILFEEMYMLSVMETELLQLFRTVQKLSFPAMSFLNRLKS